MSPLTRALAIAVLVLTPILVVVFQRLEDIREIIRKRKNGELSLSPQSWFETNPQNKSGDPKTNICPNCHSVNPPDHQFCGYCGAAISSISSKEEPEK